MKSFPDCLIFFSSSCLWFFFKKLRKKIFPLQHVILKTARTISKVSSAQFLLSSLVSTCETSPFFFFITGCPLGGVHSQTTTSGMLEHVPWWRRWRSTPRCWTWVSKVFSTVHSCCALDALGDARRWRCFCTDWDRKIRNRKERELVELGRAKHHSPLWDGGRLNTRSVFMVQAKEHVPPSLVGGGTWSTTQIRRLDRAWI